MPTHSRITLTPPRNAAIALDSKLLSASVRFLLVLLLRASLADLIVRRWTIAATEKRLKIQIDVHA